MLLRSLRTEASECWVSNLSCKLQGSLIYSFHCEKKKKAILRNFHWCSGDLAESRWAVFNMLLWLMCIAVNFILFPLKMENGLYFINRVQNLWKCVLKQLWKSCSEGIASQPKMCICANDENKHQSLFHFFTSLTNSFTCLHFFHKFFYLSVLERPGWLTSQGWLMIKGGKALGSSCVNNFLKQNFLHRLIPLLLCFGLGF